LPLFFFFFGAGGWELITLYRGAVGVTVTRNYLHDFLFVGVRCGADTGYIMDCHLNNITYNYIWNPEIYSTNFTDVNNAGIYTCTHFFNPGEALPGCECINVGLYYT